MIAVAIFVCIMLFAYVAGRIVDNHYDHKYRYGNQRDVSSIPPPPRVHAKDFISPDLAKYVEEKAFAHFLLRYRLNLKRKETQNGTMTIIHQQWYKERCVLIIDTETLSTVQVSVRDANDTDNRIDERTEAFIHSLWVDESFRKQGVGRKLLDIAEREVRHMGCKFACSGWDHREAPEWVLRWFNRMGYSGQRMSDNFWLLTKKL